MKKVAIAYAKNKVFTYIFLSETEKHIYFKDIDGTELRISKESNKMYEWDMYNKHWKYKANTSNKIIAVQVREW